MVAPETPRLFFEEHVKPNYEDWLAEPCDQRLAKNAVQDANTMAARVFHYWNAKGLEKINRVGNEEQYRHHLTANECKDFGLVQDVANAHKHAFLDRGKPRVSSHQQTKVGSTGYGLGRYGEGVFGGAAQIVVTLDDESTRPLTAIMKNVMEMWERLLTQWGL